MNKKYAIIIALAMVTNFGLTHTSEEQSQTMTLKQNNESIRQYLAREHTILRLYMEAAQKEGLDTHPYVLAEIALAGIHNCMGDNEKTSENEIDAFKSCWQLGSSITRLMPDEDQKIYTKILDIVKTKTLANESI